MKKKLIFLLILSTILVISGCTGTKTKRVADDEIIDVGDKWNDTDSRLVAEEMITDSLKRPWLKKFLRKHNDKLPVVIIGRIRNRSHEHINVKTFAKNIERALLNSGEVEFVAGQSERSQTRRERKDQQSYSSEDTAKAVGEETGADYILVGSLNSIINKSGGKQLKFYQVNLELIDLQSNRKVWIGEKKIKKVVKQSGFRY
ncbi:MAG: penicillin-binding protein activator LpoB [Desulfobacterales bacterium]|nr:penicillin-binding protein activator LpoB [Desulfobacterales bacterium]MCP4160670.1 penicillin-binding protein activator LpoB [Deltaproteobacteria bacterium]